MRVLATATFHARPAHAHEPNSQRHTPARQESSTRPPSPPPPPLPRRCMLSRLSLRLRGRTARLLHAPAPTGATPPGRTPAARPPGNASILLFARASTSHLAHVDRRLESTSAALAAAVSAAFPGHNAPPAQQRPPLTSPFPSFAPPPPPRRPEKAADAPSLETTAVAATDDRRGATPIQSSTPYAHVAELDTPRKYHFEVRGADAKRAFDRSKIKCMCHEVAAAASQRSRDAHVTAVAAAFDKCDKFDKNDKLKNNPSDVSDINDFFVFNRTTVADILAAKHSLYTYWGSNHWCDADAPVKDAVRKMNSQDVGALLVMDRAVLDADGDEIVTEAEFRASPQTGAMRGIVTERDYLRAVARGAVAADTKVSDIMTDFAADDGAGLISASPDTSVLAAMEIMTERRIRHIPCIVPPSKDGRTGAVMEGMVCIGDVVKALLAEEREEVQICRDFINGVYD